MFHIKPLAPTSRDALPDEHRRSNSAEPDHEQDPSDRLQVEAGAHEPGGDRFRRGGAATLLAAGRDCLLVSGIVSASGEVDLRSYGRGVPPVYVTPFEHRIAAPLLIVGSKDDPLIPKRDVDRLLERASSHTKSSVLVSGSTHGWDLLQGSGVSKRVRDAVARFIANVGAPVATGCPA